MGGSLQLETVQRPLCEGVGKELTASHLLLYAGEKPITGEHQSTAMPNRFISCWISWRRNANDGMMYSKSCMRDGS